jgi:hypothetical protein
VIGLMLGLGLVCLAIGLGMTLNWFEFGETHTKFWKDDDGA